MSFGVVQSAISSVKYCKGLLSKRSRLKNTLSVNKKKLEFKSKNATAFELKKLRNRLRYEHNKIRKKQLIAVVVVMSILIAIFLYFL